MRAEPKVRKDGRCAQCRKQMPTVTAAMRKYAGDQIDRDPFCSMACCRKWHGVELNRKGPHSHWRPATGERIKTVTGRQQEMRASRDRAVREEIARVRHLNGKCAQCNNPLPLDGYTHRRFCGNSCRQRHYEINSRNKSKEKKAA